MAGETADETVRTLIDRRAQLYLPLLSVLSTANPNFVARCSIAANKDGLTLPCITDDNATSSLPSSLNSLVPIDFSNKWGSGLKFLLQSLSAKGVMPTLSDVQGTSIALRAYVPEPVTKQSPERVFANVFAVSIPKSIVVSNLRRALDSEEASNLRQLWAFVEASSTKLLSFEPPPASVPLKRVGQFGEYLWSAFPVKDGIHTLNTLKQLVQRSLDLACIQAGMIWCDDRKAFFFQADSRPNYTQSYEHVDGRRTRVALTGEISYGHGDRAEPFRYQLCPRFRVGFDEEGRCWVTMRIYIRITNRQGVPYAKKAITRRRRQVAKSWWNKQFLDRTLGLIQAISRGESTISIGSSGREVVVSTTPMCWECPVSLDYDVIERIGDFQAELAELRFEEFPAEEEENSSE